MPSKKNVGRPPTGIQDRVRLSTFLTPWGRALLEALCQEEDRPAYEVVEEGIRRRLEDLDADRRERVEKMARVLERRTRRETMRRRQKD